MAEPRSGEAVEEDKARRRATADQLSYSGIKVALALTLVTHVGASGNYKAVASCPSNDGIDLTQHNHSNQTQCQITLS